MSPAMAKELSDLGVVLPPPDPKPAPPPYVAWKPSYPGEQPPF